MQQALGRTDWSVLSALLRFAQRDGWRVDFAPDLILVSFRRAQPGVIALPAAMLHHGRQAGWSASNAPGQITLRHAAVRFAVVLRLGG